MAHTEVLIFAAFAFIQTFFHSAHAIEGLKDKFPVIHHVLVRVHIERLHFIVWLGHPVVVKTIQDYAIHFVIYSGKVIAAH